MRWYCIFSAAFLAASQAWAQQPPAPSPAPTLKLFVLQGRDAVNDITGRTPPLVPIIEVRDLNDQPVEGAEVIFELPAGGPGGFFPGNKITFTTRTNPQGQASAPFTPNQLAGRFMIQATATSADRFGRVSIQQMNATVLQATEQNARPSSRKKWLILAGIGAAAATGAAVAIANHGSSTPAAPAAAVTPPPTIIVTPGTPVFGGR